LTCPKAAGDGRLQLCFSVMNLKRRALFFETW